MGNNKEFVELVTVSTGKEVEQVVTYDVESISTVEATSTEATEAVDTATDNDNESDESKISNATNKAKQIRDKVNQNQGVCAENCSFFDFIQF